MKIFKRKPKTDSYYGTRIPLEMRLKIYKSFPNKTIWEGKQMSCLCGFLGSHPITQKYVHNTTNLDVFLNFFPEIQVQKPVGIMKKYQYWWDEGEYEPRKEAIDKAIDMVKKSLSVK